MNSAVANVVRLVEQLVHHRHVALADLQDVAVRRRHCYVDARREQYSGTPRVGRQPNPTCRGHGRDPANLRVAACPGNVGLSDIHRLVREQVLEVEAGELPLAGGNGNDCRAAHLGETGVVVRRYGLLKPGEVVLLQLPGQAFCSGHVQRAVGVYHQLHVGAYPATCGLNAADRVFDGEAIASNDSHFNGGKALGCVAAHLLLSLVARRPATGAVAADRVPNGA